ncbi:MAG: type II secretion system protein J [Flavobacteriales bacterium]
MDIKSRKIKGSTLIESIAAMAIISIVMGIGFTLYANVVQSQKAVLKARSSVEMNNLDAQISYGLVLEEIQTGTDFYSTSIESGEYLKINGLNHHAVTFLDKSGKKIRQGQMLTPVKP